MLQIYLQALYSIGSYFCHYLIWVNSKIQLLSLENLPGDMSLSVMECVQLYDAMVKTGTVSDTLEVH